MEHFVTPMVSEWYKRSEKKKSYLPLPGFGLGTTAHSHLF